MPPLNQMTALVLMFLGGSMAVSQFQSDASFSIVDTDLLIPTPNTTLNVTAFSPLVVQLNPLFGFDQPPPVLLRGEDGLDPETGIFNIVDDGYYVFIIHMTGVSPGNTSLSLSVVPFNANSTNETLADVADFGPGTIDTVHVAAELRSGDIVVIANPLDETVIGDTDNPFIFNAFLLAHKPISPFPRVRQSAFSAVVIGNLSEADTTLINYETALDIGKDFNDEDGTFLAPFRGLYIFHLSVTFLSDSSDRPAVALTVNGIERARAQVRTNGNALQLTKNAAVTIAQFLQQNDAVEVVNVVPTSDTVCLTTLVGYLLS